MNSFSFQNQGEILSENYDWSELMETLAQYPCVATGE
jgi:hypothetical protein